MAKLESNDVAEFAERLFGGLPDDWLDADKPTSYAMEQFTKAVADIKMLTKEDDQ